VFGVTVRLMSYTLQFIRGTGPVGEAITRMPPAEIPIGTGRPSLYVMGFVLM
jgi:hypothetical protein